MRVPATDIGIHDEAPDGPEIPLFNLWPRSVLQPARFRFYWAPLDKWSFGPSLVYHLNIFVKEKIKVRTGVSFAFFSRAIFCMWR